MAGSHDVYAAPPLTEAIYGLPMGIWLAAVRTRCGNEMDLWPDPTVLFLRSLNCAQKTEAELCSQSNWRDSLLRMRASPHPHLHILYISTDLSKVDFFFKKNLLVIYQQWSF